MCHRRAIVVSTVVVFLLVLLVVQIWLLVGAEHAGVAGDLAVPLASAAISALCAAMAITLASRLPR